jgi:hypothetical protein
METLTATHPTLGNTHTHITSTNPGSPVRCQEFLTYVWHPVFPIYIHLCPSQPLLSLRSVFTLASGQRYHNLSCLCLESQSPCSGSLGNTMRLGPPVTSQSCRQDGHTPALLGETEEGNQANPEPTQGTLTSQNKAYLRVMGSERRNLDPSFCTGP